LAAIAGGLLLGLPLLGSVLAGKSPAPCFEFPPMTRYVAHAPFSPGIFAVLASVILLAIAPFFSWRRLGRGKNRQPFGRPSYPFPGWGLLGLATGLLSWLFAWTRFDWLAPFQPFTFTPLWLSYIVVVSAFTERRTGSCLLRRRTAYFLLLFPASAVFWWFFEYLNRYVQNWYYVGIEQFSAVEYVVYATLAFATVLPAVISTTELFAGYAVAACLDGFRPLRPPSRSRGWPLLMIAAAGLAGISVRPDYFFPLLWIAPLLIITALQLICGDRTIFRRISAGDWRLIWQASLAALLCGFFWEMWNFGSQAKWLYSIPYVDRFHIFEMPLLGYAGYLPFGLECLLIADIIASWRGIDLFLTFEEISSNSNHYYNEHG